MTAWLPGILVALVGIIPAVLVWFQTDKARKQAAEQASKSDVREAFESAKRLYEGGLQEAQRQIDACNKRVAELEVDLEAARVREKGLRQWVARLENALRRANLAIPNGTDVL
jgi:predicted nuclease with TOPRIM domain